MKDLGSQGVLRASATALRLTGIASNLQLADQLDQINLSATYKPLSAYCVERLSLAWHAVGMTPEFDTIYSDTVEVERAVLGLCNRVLNPPKQQT